MRWRGAGILVSPGWGRRVWKLGGKENCMREGELTADNCVKREKLVAIMSEDALSTRDM